MPGVGLEPSFLEEPVMLLAIVLLGRTLEARARLRATGEPPCPKIDSLIILPRLPTILALKRS